MTTYQLLYGAAWIVFVGILFCGGVAAIGAGDLGLSPVMASWVGLAGLIFGGIQSFLPPLQRFPAKDDNSGPARNPDPMPRDT